mgnify:CR=1 FL=1
MTYDPPVVADETFLNFGAALLDHAGAQGDKPAVILEDRRVSWSDFGAMVAQVAGKLRDLGIGRGDTVASLAENSIEHVVLYSAVVTAGACIVPLPFSATAEALTRMMSDSGSRLLFASPAQIEVARSLGAPQVIALVGVMDWAADAAPAGAADVQPDDLFNIIYSSGTTGLPKGIVQTHRARMHWAFSNAVEMGFDSRARALVTTPLYSNGTWLMMLPVLFAGGTLHVMPSFDAAEFLQTVERERITHTFMVPAQYIMVLDRPELDHADLSSLKTVLSAGSPLRRDTKRQVIERISPGLFELYGYSEGFASILRPSQHDEKFDTVGTPVIGFEVCILDDEGRQLPAGEAGEIAGYGAGIMTQYHDRPEQTAELIWRDARGRSFIRSGDIGMLDEDGFLKILDRKKDMIISGGFNVFPSDVETIVGQHPDVKDVTVIGVPHRKWGEWCNARLAKTQRLVGVELRDEFPRNALGKVIKKDLRAPYWDGVDS